jgi:hypothetical protein
MRFRTGWFNQVWEAEYRGSVYYGFTIGLIRGQSNLRSRIKVGGTWLKLKLHRLKPDWKRASRRLDEDETIGKREVDH